MFELLPVITAIVEVLVFVAGFKEVVESTVFMMLVDMVEEAPLSCDVAFS